MSEPMISSEQITIVVVGKPVAKGRARSTMTGRHYTPETTRVAESAVVATWYQNIGIDREPHDGPFTIEIVSAFEPPVSWAKWKREAALAGSIRHTTKPDADNLLKLVTDALNEHAYVDDSRAFHVSALKKYSETASTTITMTFHPTTEYHLNTDRKDNAWTQ